jgi:hypothetical protein
MHVTRTNVHGSGFVLMQRTNRLTIPAETIYILCSYSRYTTRVGNNRPAVHIRPASSPIVAPFSVLSFLTALRKHTVSCQVWSNGGMILAEDNRGTGRKTSPSASMTTTNPTRNDLGQKFQCQLVM